MAFRDDQWMAYEVALDFLELVFSLTEEELGDELYERMESAGFALVEAANEVGWGRDARRCERARRKVRACAAAMEKAELPEAVRRRASTLLGCELEILARLQERMERPALRAQVH